MKKILLSLGTVAAVVAPVVSVIACGNTVSEKEKAITELKGLVGYSNFDNDGKASFDNQAGKLTLDELKKEIEKAKLGDSLGNTDSTSTGEGSTSTGSGSSATAIVEKALMKHFETADDFNNESLVDISDQTGDYARNQFLFKGGTKALQSLLDAYGATTIADLDDNKSALDGLAQQTRAFLKQSDDPEFAALKASETAMEDGQSNITFGLFKSNGATDDDSVLIAINGTSLETAKKLFIETKKYIIAHLQDGITMAKTAQPNMTAAEIAEMTAQITKGKKLIEAIAKAII